jgi:hypothetical protein
LARAFRNDGDGTVSLNALPRTEKKDSDALLALLYGFNFILKKESVLCGDLLTAAKMSGLTVTRADRLLNGCNGFVTKAGHKRGAKYGLTNPGIAHAEQIVNKLFE